MWCACHDFNKRTHKMRSWMKPKHSWLEIVNKKQKINAQVLTKCAPASTDNKQASTICSLVSKQHSKMTFTRAEAPAAWTTARISRYTVSKSPEKNHMDGKMHGSRLIAWKTLGYQVDKIKVLFTRRNRLFARYSGTAVFRTHRLSSLDVRRLTRQA